jgi:hypothetical protein
MRALSRFSVLAALVGASLAVAGGSAWAQAGPAPARSARSGLIAKSAHHQFEVFFFPTGVRVFPQGPSGEPIDVSRVTGTATFYHPNSPKPWFSRPLVAEAVAPGQAPTSLELAIGLTNVPPQGVRVTFEVNGLSGSTETAAPFTIPFEFAPAPVQVAVATQPTAPPTGAAPVPRYTYGPGYQGYGYYENTSPAPASPAPGSRAAMYAMPGMSGPGGMSVGPGHRDWSTGRDVPLAKPWMRAMDR